MNRHDLQRAYAKALQEMGFERVRSTRTTFQVNTRRLPAWKAHKYHTTSEDLLLTLTLFARETAPDNQYIGQIALLYNDAVTFDGYKPGEPLTISKAPYTAASQYSAFTDAKLIRAEPVIIAQPVIQP
ncbi:MAG: hypothetical protein HRT94_01980 [Alphaproteobacteria bacterium]|nr:hypothetical protein [Alphaproteobacteria bacterium]